ncbi:MAG: UDP-2,3-diacylglucosamine diphosphatase, partial [Pseudobdellovibrio sp.]
ENYTSRLRAKKTGILGEMPQFKEAAEELSRRGFDAVVFGHTHHAGTSQLESGAVYMNPGSWMLSTHYVEIQNGSIHLKEWKA